MNIRNIKKLRPHNDSGRAVYLVEDIQGDMYVYDEEDSLIYPAIAIYDEIHIGKPISCDEFDEDFIDDFNKKNKPELLH